MEWYLKLISKNKITLKTREHYNICYLHESCLWSKVLQFSGNIFGLDTGYPNKTNGWQSDYPLSV